MHRLRHLRQGEPARPSPVHGPSAVSCPPARPPRHSSGCCAAWSSVYGCRTALSWGCRWWAHGAKRQH